MYYVGIDWGSEKHLICILNEAGEILREFVIKHNGQGFRRLETTLSKFDTVEINIERSDGILVDWLVSEGYAVYVTAPRMMAARRSRKSKDDRGDAYVLANMA